MKTHKRKMYTYRLLKGLKLAIRGLMILCSLQMHARSADDVPFIFNNTDSFPSTSLYFELGGKFFPSLTVDFRRREDFAVSFGAGLWKDNEEHEQILMIPSVNAYYFAGKRKRIEIGGGTGPFISTYEGLASILVFGNVGYRYQKKKGLLFRAGFTPFIGFPVSGKSRFMITPWVGISLGYSF